MKRLSLLSLLWLFLVFCATSAAAAGITVKFIEPEKFTDMPFSPAERESTLAELQKHFAKLEKSLPPGKTLSVEVLDIDLAGEVEPNFRQGGREVRVLRGRADWPSLKLRYHLESAGTATKSGETRLTSMNYLHEHNRYFSNEPLRFEKQMLDNWFRDVIK